MKGISRHYVSHCSVCLSVCTVVWPR